ncbi:hypothetical protein AB0M79_35250 [Polymorphospora sp. NPDC051019]|uniref:WD40 repeat domain-containing protein n=1 Tax=Polymorphospora sp. NPDC051019 TaxID=3155725 RepID=UPI0034433070
MQIYGSNAYRSPSRSFRTLFSADGRTLLVRDMDRSFDNDMVDALQAMDVDTGQFVVGDRVEGFVPVGDVVVAALAADPSTLGVYRVRDLAPVRTVPIGVPADDERLVAGGGTVAALSHEAGSLVVLDTRSWQARQVDIPGKPACVAISDDGAHVVVGTGQGRTGRVVVVDAATGTVRYVLTGPRKAVESVAVHGDLVIAGVEDLVLTWTLPTATAAATGTRRPTAAPKARTLHTFGNHWANIVGVTPGGLVIAHNGHVIAAVDPATGQVAWSSPDLLRSSQLTLAGDRMICTLAGDRLITSGERAVSDRDPETGAVRQAWPMWGVFIRGVTPQVVAVTKAGVGRVDLLRKNDGAAHHPAGHGCLVRDVSFDGERFATAGYDRWAFVWTRGRADPIAVVDGGHHGPPGQAVHLTDDQLYTSFGGCVQRWSLDGSKTPTLWAESTGFDDNLTLIRLLPASDLLLVAVRAARWGAGELCLLDPTTLEKVDRSALDWTVYAAEPLDERRLLLRGDRVTVEYDTVAGRRIRRKIHAGQPDTRTHRYLYPHRSLQIEKRTYVTTKDTGELAERGWLTVTDPTDGTVRHDRIETVEFTGRGDLAADGVFATPHPDAIRLWDLDAGKVLHELPTPPLIHQLWWFPDGRSLLASTYNGGLHEVPGPRPDADGRMP